MLQFFSTANWDLEKEQAEQVGSRDCTVRAFDAGPASACYSCVTPGKLPEPLILICKLQPALVVVPFK